MECHTEWREIAMQEPRWEQFEKQSPDSYSWTKTTPLRYACVAYYKSRLLDFRVLCMLTSVKILETHDQIITI
jgi:hypothetical protein